MTTLISIEDLYILYQELNKKYFEGKLPNKVTIEWSSKLTRAAGNCYPIKKIIRLSTHYHEKFPEEIPNTLLHEMIHLIARGHGKDFKIQLERIHGLGGEVTRYAKEAAIVKPPSWKWICTKCNKIYLRHRKGAKYYRCGICKGKLKDNPIK